MASGEILRRKKTDTISSSYCRLCHKFLVPTQAGKFATPRADLFLSLKNKEFTSHLEVQEVILSDLINSLTSQKIFENDGLPRVCCLPCGRSLVRSYATLNKLIKKLHDDPTGALKRKPPGSPGSPSTKVLPKKAKISDQSRTGLIGYTRRKILSSSSKENVGISPLTQQGQVSSTENKFEKSALSGEGDKSITQIFISSPGGKKVTYAPKGLEKTLVRAIAFQNPKCCARAALKLPSWKPFLITKFSSHLNKEAVTYFKRNNLLKMSNQSNPSDIARLKIEDVEKELHECMPTTMKFMEALSGITARRENEEREKRKIASGKKKKSAESKDASINRLSQELTARNCCTVAVSMLLKQHFANMSKLLYRSTLLMMNGGCRALDIDRLNSQGILMSHSSGVKMQNKMAKEFGKSVEEWKQGVTRKELMIRLLLDIHNQIKECDGNLTLDHIKSCPSYDTNVLDGVKSYIQCETDDPCKILDTTEKITKALKEIKQSIVDYSLVEDNCDIFVISRHQTSSTPNRIFNWSLHFAVQNRIKRNPVLNSVEPQCNVKNLDMAKLLPGKSTIESFMSAFPQLVGRIIIKYMQAYSKFKHSIVRHIPHQYSEEMSKESKMCLLGIKLKNPNKSGDMAELLKEFQEVYVPRKGDQILKPIILHGDVTTEERGRHVQWTYRMNDTPFKQLKGLDLTFAEFHMKMCLYEVSNKIFLKPDSVGELGTAQSLMTRTGSSNAKKGPKQEYNAFKDFHMSETEGHILAAWMQFTGMNSLDATPSAKPIPAGVENGSLAGKQTWFLNEIKEFLNKFVFDKEALEHLEGMSEKITEMKELETEGFLCRYHGCGRKFKYHSGRVNHERNNHPDLALPLDLNQTCERDEFGYFYCRLKCGHTYRSKQGRNRHERTKHPNEHIPSHTESVSFSEKKTEEEDFLMNYHVARLRFGLLDLFVRDSIQEGDGARILLCLPYLLLLFHHYKRTKYSYVILLHLVKVYALLPESLAHELVYCRFWNTKGGAGNNIPLDLRMEHMVRLFKLSLKQLGANIESKGAQRIAQSLSHVEKMIHNIDYDGSIVKRSGYHSTKHLRETVTQTVSDLFEIGAFKEEKGRKHPSFPKFSKNVVDKMNFTEYYSWMARLMKLWEAVYKA